MKLHIETIWIGYKVLQSESISAAVVYGYQKDTHDLIPEIKGNMLKHFRSHFLMTEDKLGLNDLILL